jgi:hypothetical protein
MMEKIFYVVMGGLVLLSFFVMANQAIDCSKAGGTLVRGLLLLECIK